MSITIINPFVLDAVTNITRTFQTAGYIAGGTTTTSTTYTDLSTLSSTEVSGSDYATFWQAAQDNPSTTNDARARLFETSQRQLSNIESQDTTDVFSTGGVYSFSSNGASKTFTVQHSSEGGQSVLTSGIALNLLKLEGGEFQNYNSGNTNGTWSTAASVVLVGSLTSPFTLNYIVIASGMVAGSGNARVFDGSTAYGELGVAMNQDGTSYSPYFHIERFSVSSNTTISLQQNVDIMRQATIIALREDLFQNVYYSNQATQTTTTSNSFVDAFTYAPSLQNPGNYHLLIASAHLQSSATNQSAAAALQNQSRGTYYNTTHFRENNATTEWYPTIVNRIVSFVDTNPTIAWEFYSEAGNTARLRNMGIAIFDLGVPAPDAYFIAYTSSTTTSIDISNLAEPSDVVVIASHSTSTSQTTPTGFTSISNSNNGTVYWQASYKVMGATPDTSATVGSNASHIAMIFRNVNTTTVIDVTPTEADQTGNSGMPDAPSITTSNPSILLLLGALDDDSISADVTAPSGFTMCGREENSGTIMAAFQVQAGTGTTDPNAFGGGGNDAWWAASIPLRLA